MSRRQGARGLQVLQVNVHCYQGHRYEDTGQGYCPAGARPPCPAAITALSLSIADGGSTQHAARRCGRLSSAALTPALTYAPCKWPQAHARNPQMVSCCRGCRWCPWRSCLALVTVCFWPCLHPRPQRRPVRASSNSRIGWDRI